VSDPGKAAPASTVTAVSSVPGGISLFLVDRDGAVQSSYGGNWHSTAQPITPNADGPAAITAPIVISTGTNVGNSLET